MEYAIPRADLAKALLRVRDLIEDEGLRVDFPIELRVAAADDIPLSTADGRETCVPRRAPVLRHAGRDVRARTSTASRRS